MSHIKQEHRHGDESERDPQPNDPRPPLRVEMVLFALGVAFFGPLAVIYGFWSNWDPVGTIGLLLLTGLYGLVAGYLWVTSRRIDPRAEDDPLGEVEESAGEVGVFAPQSWWPLVLGLAAALAFLGVAIDWWIFGIGLVVAALGLVGQLFEFSRGQHAH